MYHMLINNTCFCATWHSSTHNRFVEPHHWANGSDVTEFNPNPNVVGYVKIIRKSEIRRIFTLANTGFGFNFHFGKPSFITRCSLLSSILLFYYYSVSAFCGE